MAPEPILLHHEEIMKDNSLGITQRLVCGRSVQSVPSVELTLTGGQQENVPPTPAQHTQRTVKFEDNGIGQELHQQQAPGGVVRIIYATNRTPPKFTGKQQRNPRGKGIARNSLSPSNNNTTSSKAKVADPPEARQNALFGKKGEMIRHEDLLDRTFDNVENISCGRTSISKAPPAPIFACTVPGNSHHNSHGADEAIDPAALSSAKQQGYTIEQYDHSEDGEQAGIESTYTATVGRRPLIPVNKIFEDQSKLVKQSVSANTERAIAPTKTAMMDLFFGDVLNMMCREDRALATKPDDTQQVELRRTQENGKDLKGEMKKEDFDDCNDPSPIDPIVSDLNFHSLVNSCDEIFDTRSDSLANLPKEGTTQSSHQSQSFPPIRHEETVMAPNDSSRLRTGMMLLADGSIVFPDQNSSRWIQRQEKRHDSRMQHSQSTSSIRLCRENSLLDVLCSSPENDKPVLPTSFRQPTRSIQKRDRTNGETNTIIIPRRSHDEEEGHVESGQKSFSSVDQMEREHFWKQIVFAATILLLSCGLIVFAVSFFWPTHKMA